MLFRSKARYLCDIWRTAIRDLNHFHGAWAIGLGWGYFIWGVFLHWGDVEAIHTHMYKGFWLAAWTCSFLVGIMLMKALNRIATALEDVKKVK